MDERAENLEKFDAETLVKQVIFDDVYFNDVAFLEMRSRLLGR